MSLVQQLSQDAERSGAFLCRNRLNHGANKLLWNGTQQGFQIRMYDRLAAERYGLVEQAQPVAHTAFAGPGERHQASFFEHDLVLIDHMSQPLDDFSPRNAPEVVMLAAGKNGRRNFMNLSGGKDEHDVRWRLFQRLQQR